MTETDRAELIAEIEALKASRPHEMVLAPSYPSGTMCRNCKGLSSEIAYALGPVCPESKSVTMPLDVLDRILAALTERQSDVG